MSEPKDCQVNYTLWLPYGKKKGEFSLNARPEELTDAFVAEQLVNLDASCAHAERGVYNITYTSSLPMDTYPALELEGIAPTS